MVIYSVFMLNINFCFNRYCSWGINDKLKYNNRMGLDKNVYFLDFNDYCKSNYGYYFPSNLKSKWIWYHKKINCCINLWRFKRSFRSLLVINGRCRLIITCQIQINHSLLYVRNGCFNNCSKWIYMWEISGLCLNDSLSLNKEKII